VIALGAIGGGYSRYLVRWQFFLRWGYGLSCAGISRECLAVKGREKKLRS
jgi:hypothetical protein